VGLASKKMIGFFKRPKDTIAKANTVLGYGKMGVYKWYYEKKCGKKIVKHAHEKLGHFGAYWTYNLLGGQYR
jgi:hypothetical protein